MRVLQELFRYEQPASTGESLHLRGFELFVCAWVAHFVWQWSPEIARLGAVVLPLGVANWVDVTFMFNELAPRINAALITVGCLLGLSRFARPGYALAMLGFHLQYAARYSQGEISHGSNLIGTALFTMALGALLERDALRARRFSFGFSVLLTGIGYSSAALCKLVATGPLWVRGEHLVLWIHERSIDGFGKNGEIALNSLQELLLAQPLLATLTLTFGLLAEACGILMVRPKLRPYISGILMLMHVGIWMSMDILFEVNIWFLVVLGLPWGPWFERLSGRVQRGRMPAPQHT